MMLSPFLQLYRPIFSEGSPLLILHMCRMYHLRSNRVAQWIRDRSSTPFIALTLGSRRALAQVLSSQNGSANSSHLQLFCPFRFYPRWPHFLPQLLQQQIWHLKISARMSPELALRVRPQLTAIQLRLQLSLRLNLPASHRAHLSHRRRTLAVQKPDSPLPAQSVTPIQS